jgi:hypothetical protein
MDTNTITLDSTNKIPMFKGVLHCYGYVASTVPKKKEELTKAYQRAVESIIKANSSTFSVPIPENVRYIEILENGHERNCFKYTYTADDGTKYTFIPYISYLPQVMLLDKKAEDTIEFRYFKEEMILNTGKQAILNLHIILHLVIPEQE